jgi:hypothetical protein
MIKPRRVNNWWLGAALPKSSNSFNVWGGNHKPVNMFKTNPKNIPVNMFKDSDRDGVANIFDCKPNNKNKQGLIDAIVGAVKGVAGGTGAKSGWKQGMAKQGNYATIERRSERKRAAKIQQMNMRPRAQYYFEDPGHKLPTNKESKVELIYNKPMPKSVRRMYRQNNAEDTSGFRRMNEEPQDAKDSNAHINAYNKMLRDKARLAQEKVNAAVNKSNREIENKELESALQATRARMGRPNSKANIKQLQNFENLVKFKQGVTGGYAKKVKSAVGEWVNKNEGSYTPSKVPGMLDNLQLKLARAHPRYNIQGEFREKKMNALKSRLAGLEPGSKAYASVRGQLTKVQLVHSRDLTMRERAMAKNKLKTNRRIIQEIFPPAVSYTDTGKGYRVSGIPGRKGRPKGTLDPRYAAYGGVYGYRRYKSMMKKQEKLQVQQMQMAMRQARQPQYEQQQYQQQVQMSQQQLPQEMQGQNIQTDYSQFQQAEQQVPQEPQYPQQQQREIRTPFKSSGGSPYPPVPRQGLTPTRQTIQQGYVESVDAFTGRRFLKQLPQKERWA